MSSAEESLQWQLNNVEEAIKALKAKQEEGLVITSLELPKSKEYIKIDTQVKHVACPVCFADVAENKLRHHMSHSCGGTEVVCPNVGCRERMTATELKDHVELKCPVMKRRRWLAKQSKVRELENQLRETKRQEEELLRRQREKRDKLTQRLHREPPRDADEHAFTTLPENSSGVAEHDADAVDASSSSKIFEPHLQCEKCCHIIILGFEGADGAAQTDSGVTERQLRRKLNVHMAQECPMREVCCPNRQYGCKEAVQLGMMQHHLRTQCVYEKIKDALIKRSKQRRELISCTGCGEPQPLMMLKKHELVECNNRRVPCRNWHLGCPVQVRVKERQLHEDVTIDNSTRSCLYFGGSGARMELDEDDIVPPWTIEYWMFRPSPEESAKHYIRECIHWRLNYLKCKADEAATNLLVVETKKSIEEISAAMGKADVREEKDKLFEQLQQTSTSLSDYMYAAEDAVLNSVVATERMRILIKAALEALGRVLQKGNLEPAVGTTILISLKDNMTRPKPRKVVDKKELLRLWKESKGLSTTAKSASGQTDNGANNNADQSVDVEDGPEKLTSKSRDDDNPDGEETEGNIVNLEETGVMDGQDVIPEEEPEEDMLNLCLTWPDWKWKLENFIEELEFHKAEMEMWRDENEISWKPLPKAVSTVPVETHISMKSNNDSGAEDGDTESANTDCMSKAEKKALAKQRKAEAKKRREEKKLRDALKASAEEDDDGSASVSSSKSKTKEPEKRKLRDRIYEALRGILCLDNIASSPHGNISLNVGGTGLVGVFDSLKPLLTEKEKAKSKMKKNDFPEGIQVFDTQVDRKRWVHVALVCSKVPKDVLVLYYDGVPMETLPLASFNLPMKWIGNPEFSFHGFILDLRIWAKPKSTKEIKESLHSLVEFDVDVAAATERATSPGDLVRPNLLSSTASSELGKSLSTSTRPVSRGGEIIGSRPTKVSCNGLVAWWTFEDGLGLEDSDIGPKVATDVTEYRFKTPLRSNNRAFVRWVTALKLPELTAVIPLTPEDQAAKEAADALLSEAEKMALAVPPVINRDELPCPSFREKNLCPYEIRRFYLAKRGRALMSMYPCPLQCGEFVKKMDIRFHKQYLCGNRRLQCRYKDQCAMSYFAREQDNHEKYECQRLDRRSVFLESADLKNAIELCDMCAQPLKLRDMEEHKTKECAFRVVPCMYQDCKDPICANQMKHHLKFDCRSRELKRTTLLVSRARQRLNYPRPWGIEMKLTGVEEDFPGLDENVDDAGQRKEKELMNDSSDEDDAVNGPGRKNSQSSQSSKGIENNSSDVIDTIEALENNS